MSEEQALNRIDETLDRIAIAVEELAARKPERQVVVIQLPAEFTAGEAREVLGQLTEVLGLRGDKA